MTFDEWWESESVKHLLSIQYHFAAKELAEYAWNAARSGYENVRYESEEVRSVLADAARYRWLRDPDNANGIHLLARCSPKELDQVIDQELTNESQDI